MEARRAHNPEVVGSSPASATIKNTGFRKKSGVFLTFRVEMSTFEIPMVLAAVLVLALCKINKCENPTFSGKLGFSILWKFWNIMCKLLINKVWLKAKMTLC